MLIPKITIHPENIFPSSSSSSQPYPYPFVDHNDTYVLSPNGTYFAYSTCLTPILVSENLLAHRDYCVLVLLLPRLTVHPKEDLLFSTADFSLLHHKQEPVIAITIAVLPELGAASAGTGIYSLVRSSRSFYQLQRAIDADIQELKQGLKHLKKLLPPWLKWSYEIVAV